MIRLPLLYSTRTKCSIATAMHKHFYTGDTESDTISLPSSVCASGPLLDTATSFKSCSHPCGASTSPWQRVRSALSLFLVSGPLALLTLWLFCDDPSTVPNFPPQAVKPSAAHVSRFTSRTPQRTRPRSRTETRQPWLAHMTSHWLSNTPRTLTGSFDTTGS